MVSTMMSMAVMGSVVMDAFVISITVGIVSVEVARFSVRSHRAASPISNPPTAGRPPTTREFPPKKRGVNSLSQAPAEFVV